MLEIGAVEIMHQAPTGSVFHVLINPERDVPEDAVRVHGHTAEALRDKPVFAAVVDEFLAFIGEVASSSTTPNSTCASSTPSLRGSGESRSAWSGSSTRWRSRGSKHPGQPNSLDALVRPLPHRPHRDG